MTTQRDAKQATHPDSPMPPEHLVDAAMRDVPRAMADMENARDCGAPAPKEGERVVSHSRLVQELGTKRQHGKAAAEWAIHRLAELGLVVGHPSYDVTPCAFDRKGGWAMRPEARARPELTSQLIESTPRLWAWWAGTDAPDHVALRDEHLSFLGDLAAQEQAGRERLRLEWDHREGRRRIMELLSQNNSPVPGESREAQALRFAEHVERLRAELRAQGLLRSLDQLTDAGQPHRRLLLELLRAPDPSYRQALLLKAHAVSAETACWAVSRYGWLLWEELSPILGVLERPSGREVPCAESEATPDARPIPEVADVLTVETPPARQPKRSTERGEARDKLIAALTRHHKYADGGCLDIAPIGNNELARQAGVSESTASAFFQKEFQGHTKYRATCNDSSRLAASLKLLNKEFSPYHLYGNAPPGDENYFDGE